MLATSHKLRSIASISRLGFSLLELLVVLSLLGLVTGLVFPGLAKLYQRVESALLLDQVVEEINGLGYRAYSERRELLLDSRAEKVLRSLPLDWSIRVDKPIIYNANGYCSGGQLKVYVGQSSIFSEKLDAPFCTVKRS